jgi:hypothetical protein
LEELNILKHINQKITKNIDSLIHENKNLINQRNLLTNQKNIITKELNKLKSIKLFF